jgi:hypothetical protein
MALQASGQFTSVDHPVGQVELARRSRIPGGDSNVETPGFEQIWVPIKPFGLDMHHTGAKPGGILLAVAVCANHANFGGWVQQHSCSWSS